MGSPLPKRRGQGVMAARMIGAAVGSYAVITDLRLLRVLANSSVCANGDQDDTHGRKFPAETRSDGVRRR